MAGRERRTPIGAPGARAFGDGGPRSAPATRRNVVLAPTRPRHASARLPPDRSWIGWLPTLAWPASLLAALGLPVATAWATGAPAGLTERVPALVFLGVCALPLLPILPLHPLRDPHGRALARLPGPDDPGAPGTLPLARVDQDRVTLSRPARKAARLLVVACLPYALSCLSLLGRPAALLANLLPVLAAFAGLAAPHLLAAWVPRAGGRAFLRITARARRDPRAQGSAERVLVHAVAARALRVTGVQVTAVVRTSQRRPVRRAHPRKPGAAREPQSQSPWITSLELEDRFTRVASAEQAVDARLDAGELLELRPALRLPASVPLPQPVVPQRTSDPPAIEWYLEVRLQVAGALPARAVFAMHPGPGGAHEDPTAEGPPVFPAPPSSQEDPAPGAALELVAGELEAAPSCPYCADPMQAEGLVACATCETLHHRDCWASAGACTTYGCGSTRATAARLVTFEV